VIFIVADALRWDYFYQWKLWEVFNGCGTEDIYDRVIGKNNCKVYKCQSSGAQTADSLPVMVTGIPLDKINKTYEGPHPLFRLHDQTLFDIFMDNDYIVSYNHIDHRTGVFGLTDVWQGLCEDLPDQMDIQTIIHQDHTPFFMVIHSWLTHHPYGYMQSNSIYSLMNTLQKTGNVETLHKLYRHGIQAFRAEMMRLMFKIKVDTPIYEDTLVVMCSDHGEFLGETWAGIPRIGHGSDNDEINARLLNEPIISDVPLLFYNPSLQPSINTEVSAHHLDIAPSILSFVDIPIPEYMTGEVLI
jgi:hypothetical protein